MSYQDKLQQIEQLKEDIENHGKLSDEVLKKINYKFRLEWNYTSNSMEGNSLTKQETRSVMVGNITVEGKPFKDVAEMRGHDEVINTILKIGKGELNISESRIKEIHKSIVKEEDPEKAIQIGNWKKAPNFLTNYKNERFDFTPPDEVADRMHQLINWLNTQKEKIQRGDKEALHPVQVAFQFHLDFITIHPFYDGNGRTVRILTNLILISYGYPPVYVKENEKSAYYQYLADIQGYGGAPDLFYDFMAGLLIRSQQIVLDAIQGKDIEEPDDLDKRIAMLDILLEGGDEEIKLTRNEASMKEVLRKVVDPLFRKVFEKCLKISPLFAETIFTYYIDGSGGVNNNIDDLIENIEISWTQKKGSLFKIELDIRFVKLKKLGVNAFDVNDSVILQFDNHKYIVIMQRDEPIEKLYHQYFTDGQVDQLCTKYVNRIVSYIEEQVNARKK